MLVSCIEQQQQHAMHSGQKCFLWNILSAVPEKLLLLSEPTPPYCLESLSNLITE